MNLSIADFTILIVGWSVFLGSFGYGMGYRSGIDYPKINGSERNPPDHSTWALCGIILGWIILVLGSFLSRFF